MNSILIEHILSTGQTLQIVQGDITLEEVDAIVNAANEHLQHGGGVAWAIVQRGGDVIQQESDKWIQEHGPVSHTHPAWTSGGALPAKYIIHAVGPIWGDGDEDNKLADAITGSLSVADELKLFIHCHACHFNRDIWFSKRPRSRNYFQNDRRIFQ